MSPKKLSRLNRKYLYHGYKTRKCNFASVVNLKNNNRNVKVRKIRRIKFASHSLEKNSKVLQENIFYFWPVALTSTGKKYIRNINGYYSGKNMKRNNRM